MPEVKLHKASVFPVAVATEIAASPFSFCANPPSFFFLLFSFFFIFFFSTNPTASQSSWRGKGASRQRRTWGLCLRLLLGHHPQRWDLHTRVCGSRPVFSDLRESHTQSLLSLGSGTRGSEPNQPTRTQVTDPSHGARRIEAPTPCQCQEAGKTGLGCVITGASAAAGELALSPSPAASLPPAPLGCLSRTGRPSLAQHRLCKEGMPRTPSLSQCQPRG